MASAPPPPAPPALSTRRARQASWWSRQAAIIALMYYGAAVAWILGSARITQLLAASISQASHIEIAKGLFFVSATSGLLYILVARALRARDRMHTHAARAQEQYELVLSGTNDIVWDWDIVKETTDWSPRMADIVGVALEELTRDSNKWWKRLHPDDTERVGAALKAHLDNNEPYDVEFRYMVKDGSYRWFRSRGRAVREGGEEPGGTGKAVRMVGSMADVHDRVQARRMREAQNGLLEQIASGTPTPVVLEAIIRAIEAQTPGTLASILLLAHDRRTVSAVIAPSLPDEYNRPMIGLKTGPRVGSCGTAMFTGQRVVVHDIQTDPLWEDYRALAARHGLRSCWSEPIHLHDGSIVGSFAMYHRVPRSPDTAELEEITDAAHLAGIAIERDRARAELQESQVRLSRMVSQSPVGIMLLGTDGCVQEWNGAASRIFGYSADEMLGQPVWKLVPPALHHQIGGIWSDLMHQRGGTRSSNQNVTKDGRTIDCEWYNTAMVDGDGLVVGVASIVEDVTERRRTERRQQFMLAELDHRVKNNLATIVSLAEQTGRAAHSYEQFLEAFLGRVRALARMHGALAASKWEGATVEAIVSKTLSTFAAHRSSFQADGPQLMLAPQQAQALTLALHELATNAAKHGSLRDPGGRVDVRWSATSGNDPPGASTLRLEWAESGGRAIEKPTRRGFGSELIEGMIHHELGGTVRSDYKPQGLVCTIEVPMMEHAAQGLGAGAENR